MIGIGDSKHYMYVPQWLGHNSCASHCTSQICIPGAVIAFVNSCSELQHSHQILTDRHSPILFHDVNWSGPRWQSDGGTFTSS